MNNKIIVWGMSCVGKTTYAKSLNLPYFCFDYLFPWSLVETFSDLSIEKALEYVVTECEKSSDYILDGWHLSDIEGKFIPQDCQVHVLYDHHHNIIDRYRVSIVSLDNHREMYRKWYGAIKNESNFKFFRVSPEKQPEPTTYEHFSRFCELQWLRLAKPINSISG